MNLGIPDFQFVVSTAQFEQTQCAYPSLHGQTGSKPLLTNHQFRWIQPQKPSRNSLLVPLDLAAGQRGTAREAEGRCGDTQPVPGRLVFFAFYNLNGNLMGFHLISSS